MFPLFWRVFGIFGRVSVFWENFLNSLYSGDFSENFRDISVFSLKTFQTTHEVETFPQIVSEHFRGVSVSSLKTFQTTHEVETFPHIIEVFLLSKINCNFILISQKNCTKFFYSRTMTRFWLREKKIVEFFSEILNVSKKFLPF